MNFKKIQLKLAIATLSLALVAGFTGCTLTSITERDDIESADSANNKNDKKSKKNKDSDDDKSSKKDKKNKKDSDDNKSSKKKKANSDDVANGDGNSASTGDDSSDDQNGKSDSYDETFEQIFGMTEEEYEAERRAYEEERDRLDKELQEAWTKPAERDDDGYVTFQLSGITFSYTGDKNVQPWQVTGSENNVDSMLVRNLDSEDNILIAIYDDNYIENGAKSIKKQSEEEYTDKNGNTYWLVKTSDNTIFFTYGKGDMFASIMANGDFDIDEVIFYK